MNCASSPGIGCPGLSFDTNNHVIGPYIYYDAAGNMTQDGAGTGTHTYTYDGENRLTQVDSSATLAVLYNALGQQVSWTAGGVTYDNLYDASGEFIARYKEGTGWDAAPFRLGHRMLGYYAFGSGVVRFMHADALGSATVTTDGTGAVINEQLFYPWGDLWTETTNNPLPFAGFANGWAAAGIYSTLFRMYSYGKGRWMTPDPAGLATADITNPDSWNRYAYVGNDPCSLIDPLGLDSCSFNVNFINDAGLASAQVTAAEQQINAILGAVKSPSGDTVGINWVTGGQTGTTLTATNEGWLMSLLFPGAMGAESGFLSPRVYVNNLPNASAPLIGSAGLHELAHFWLGSEVPYDPSDLNTLMYDYAPLQMQTDALLNANSTLWKLSPGQVSTLYHNCKSSHPGGNGPRAGGGGGGGGGGGNGSLYGGAPPPVGGLNGYNVDPIPNGSVTWTEIIHPPQPKKE